jgi:ABC-type branched-subunit amino acid transport system substrate-binding protein
MTSTGEVAVPLTATDLTPSVASATKDGTDGIAGFLVGQAQGTLLTTIKQQGFEGPVATTSAFLTPQLLDSLGAQLDGVYAVSSTRPATSSSPGIDMFLADMKAYDSELPPTDGAINNWAATWLFERVVADLDEITAETVRAAIEQVTDMDMGGIVPPLTLTKPAETMPGVTRVFNPTVTFQTVEDGQLVLAGDEADPFVDPFASASGS